MTDIPLQHLWRRHTDIALDIVSDWEGYAKSLVNLCAYKTPFIIRNPDLTFSMYQDPNLGNTIS
ncbi:MAG: hypothetical protein KBA82_09085 [Nitrosomonas sp.]|jgi:hypothetical protein|nr:hypothetical protein [Nitrosomonas sp.]MBP7113108.1 hypothetical protein [Nitrosomonas sp.]